MAELADGTIFRVNEAFDSTGARQSAFEAFVSDYETLVSGEPAVRSDFNIYLHEDTLIYFKEPCARADTEARFFLHLYPVEVNDLPDHRRGHGFRQPGLRFHPARRDIRREMLGESPPTGIRHCLYQYRPVRPPWQAVSTTLGRRSSFSMRQ